jgi:hypothetical protein
MIIEIIPLIVLAIAAFRITRFLIIDDLIHDVRARLYTFLANQAQKNGKLKFLWEKIYDLSACTWCTGFWVSVALYWTYIWTSPMFWSRFDVINIFAIAGIQGFLHALEPSDD